MQENSILRKLEEYSKSDFYPFHMPGHKRQEICDFPNPYSIDITEIDGFDNLHHAEGILKDSMERAARIYGADRSYYLVNGSTCGILSAIFACTGHGGKILMARNCHKAAYHGAVLNWLETEYLYPEYLEECGINGGIRAEDVRAALERGGGKIQAVLIVSPTYEGIISDVQAIADVAHEFGVPLIVDEAHGAHLPFACHVKDGEEIGKDAGTVSEGKSTLAVGAGDSANCADQGDEEEKESRFPKSALECGADIVIQSLHKTLPSFTQTAILHVKSDLVKCWKVERYLGMFQSSSPSYLFMAGMERCAQFMDEDGRELMKEYEARMERFFESLKDLKVLKVLGHEVCEEDSVFDWDMSKVVISTKQAVRFAHKNDDEDDDEDVARFGGEALGEILRKQYHLEMEMTAPEYVIAMTSLMDTEEGLKRLSDALVEIDEKLCEEILQTVFHDSFSSDKKRLDKDSMLAKMPKAAPVMKLSEAMEMRGERIPFADSVGRISQEFVYLYPPGIPVLAPGEMITKEILGRITWYQNMGLSVQGVADPSLYSIITVAEA